MNEEKRNAAALSDADLEGVTGGTGAAYQYWFSDENSNAERCSDGKEHTWIKSSTGSFEYCSKCYAERYKLV